MEFAFTLQVWSSLIEVAAFASITASGMMVIIGGFHVFVTTYRVRHEQRTFLLGNKWPQVPFRSPSLSLRLESIDGFLNDNRGYKKKACRGLFRDRGSSLNFREKRTKTCDRLQLREIRAKISETHNPERIIEIFQSPVARIILYFPSLYPGRHKYAPVTRTF